MLASLLKLAGLTIVQNPLSAHLGLIKSNPAEYIPFRKNVSYLL
jgi:hypothetical protein